MCVTKTRKFRRLRASAWSVRRQLFLLRVWRLSAHKVRTKLHELLVHFRWCAPEVCLSLQFTSKSDVWSYGVVLFELMTLGADPYPQCQTVEQVSLCYSSCLTSFPRFNLVYVPEIHHHALEVVRNKCKQYTEVRFLFFRCKLMRSCWSREPDDRPNFSDLVVELETLKEMPEFHDAKPYLPSGGHCNEAFDVSIDSSSSEKQDYKVGSMFPIRNLLRIDRCSTPPKDRWMQTGSVSQNRRCERLIQSYYQQDGSIYDLYGEHHLDKCFIALFVLRIPAIVLAQWYSLMFLLLVWPLSSSVALEF